MSESLPESSSPAANPAAEGVIETADAQVSQVAAPNTPVAEQPLAAKTSIVDSRLVGFERIDPRFVRIERVGGWIGFLVVGSCFVVGIGCAAWFHLLPVIGLVGLSALAIVVLSWLAWMAHTFPRLQYEATGWRLDDSGFVIRTGYFWRKVVSVPRARVQHADVQQGPLMRYFKLAKLVVHTAGTQNAFVELQGLNYAVAERLRDALIEDREMNDGV